MRPASGSAPPLRKMMAAASRLVSLRCKRVLVVATACLLVVYMMHDSNPFPECLGCVRDRKYRSFQSVLLQEAQGAANGSDVVFVGDSITEAFRGSSYGSHECLEYRCAGIPEVFGHFFSRLKTLVLAISGDQTAHVKWRLTAGEGVALRKARAVVLHIGTNDLSQLVSRTVGGWKDPRTPFVPHGEALSIADELAARVQSTVDTLKSYMAPGARIIVVGLLPRGPSYQPSSFAWPNDVYTTAILTANKQLSLQYDEDDSVDFVSCVDVFLVVDDRKINEELMKDSLHPTDKGTKLLLDCIKPSLLQMGVNVSGDSGD
ncbi:hypothetical protein DIPPA_28150 [Diplonema papillatum]|nr:hypothetical protein DIPPA_28150 [Diplonema papillatum]